MAFMIDDAFLPATLTAHPMTDEEFAGFCAEHPDLFFEMTGEGEIIVMPPTYSLTGARSGEIFLQLGAWAKRDGRGIVYAVAALFDDPLDLRETNFAGIVIFQGAAGHEAEVIDGKDNSTEDRLVAGVKRTVDENVCALDPSAHREESDCTR
jgi:hypothetical protein